MRVFSAYSAYDSSAPKSYSNPVYNCNLAVTGREDAVAHSEGFGFRVEAAAALAVS